MELYDARRFAHTLGGHHGILPSSNTVKTVTGFDKGNEKWKQARLKLIEEVRNVFTPPKKIQLPREIEDQNTLLMLLLGLTTTADWLGSDERFFDYEDRFLQPKDYALVAKERAQEALRQTGWLDNWQASGETIGFSAMFPFLPNEIQAKVMETADDLRFPSLLILEAPTGIGKTEAALYLADTWLQKEKGRGIYIAMPTQATSNQIFERTLDFLNQRYDQKINIQLAHGQALWNEKMQELRLSSIGEGPADAENKMNAEAWFMPRKKTLLAPFGVGTVDQALMGILQSRHFYLRLFGLANKVVIFDEVHAYDTYMSKLFLRLLTWLRAVGASVIVLSATLPEETRKAMTKVFAPQVPDNNPQAEYPRLTLVTSEEEKNISLPAPDDCTIQLIKIAPASESIIQSLKGKLSQGGCAAVICNTVRRAQEIYLALQEANFINGEDLTLFHSRFPPAWRNEIEKKVLEQIGKNGKRPHKAIVVATQVIEQSLDLDFDLMLSELAPIDLLIQRIGRLHRHKRDARPPGLILPQLLLAQPEGDANVPQFGDSKYVYEPYVLWQTWLSIRNRNLLHLPSETSELIEAVYGDFDAMRYPEEIISQLEKARLEMQKNFREDSYKAESNLIPQPAVETLFTNPMQDLKDDEDPTIHQQLKAVTRLIPPGVNLVCLHRMDDETLNTEPDGSGEIIDLSRVPDRETVQELLLHSVALHRQDVVHLLAEKAHSKWQRKTALRYHIPLVFEQSRCPLEGADLTLTLSKELGLQVEKETL
jgi:CRISPR-associated endonuclease/helicase Cas3